MAEAKARHDLDREQDRERPPRARPARTGDAVVCVTGKTGFPEVEARRRLELYSAGSRPNRPRRVYRCGKCGAWHLTSEEER